MPLKFWNDKNDEKFKKAYFSRYKNIWHHGDYAEIKKNTGGFIIYGRSDTTLNPGGVRLGTSEITRLGMKESEMKEIASLMKQVIVDKKDAGEIASHVKEFKTDFKKTQYCFDNKLGAYEYVKLR